MDEEIRLCPLRVLGSALGVKQATASTRCIAEACAWWNEGATCCGVIAPGVLQAVERDLIERIEETYGKLAELMAE